MIPYLLSFIIYIFFFLPKGCFPDAKRKELKEKVFKSMRVYSGKEDDSEPECRLADEFRTLFRDGRLPNWTMDVVTRKKFLLPTQVT